MRAAVIGQRRGELPKTSEVDRQDGEDGAKLNQDLKRLAGRVKAEEMPGEDDVSGGRNGDELSQPFEQAEKTTCQVGMIGDAPVLGCWGEGLRRVAYGISRVGRPVVNMLRD